MNLTISKDANGTVKLNPFYYEITNETPTIKPEYNNILYTTNQIEHTISGYTTKYRIIQNHNFGNHTDEGFKTKLGEEFRKGRIL